MSRGSETHHPKHYFAAEDGKTPTCGFSTFTGPFFFQLTAALPKSVLFFFEVFDWRSVECVVTLEPRTTRHSAPAAVTKVNDSTNPERVLACNRRHSNSCKPSAPFLTASNDTRSHSQGRLWRSTLPREAALPQIESCLRARGHGCRRS